MYTYDKPSSYKYLSHHGILGQRWGKRNGPPYPLGASDHSAAEKKAGWRKSLDKGGEKNDNKKRQTAGAKEKRGLTSGQKKAIAIGATAAAVALATYGAYRMGYLDKLQDKGKILTGNILGKIGDQPLSKSIHKTEETARDSKTGFRLVKESLSESLSRTNPLRGSSEGTNNCTYSAVAGFLRTLGYDVTAKGTGGKMQNLGGIVEDCFKGARVFEGSATKFGKSPEDAAEFLKKRFGDNAAGAVGIQFRGGRGGHTFNWQIVNGVVNFLDFQQGSSGDAIKNVYWSMIDPDASLTVARLDNAEINLETILKYVNPRK